MELFAISRYTGEDEVIKSSPNEEDLRAKLLEKISERKRRSLANLNEEKDGNKKRKIKSYDISKRIDQIGASLESDLPVKSKMKRECDAVGEEISNERKNKIKKRRKKKDVDSDQVNEIKSNSECEDGNEDENEIISNNEQGGFTILKDPKLLKRGKVKRVLPEWLANPSVVSVDLKNLSHTIHSIPELDEIFVNKLKENGITHFFPVQQQVIPCLLHAASRPKMYWPNDICVSAPTGSGKTLAFVLPILQVLHKRIVPKIRALIVLPVQDLAKQVFHVFKTYSQGTNINVVLLSKIRSFEEEQNLLLSHDGMGNCTTLADIVVTTPGRLVEHLIKTKGLSFEDLMFLVIDEADKVMENMQNDWLYHLNKHLNSECTRAYQVPIITYNNLVNQKRPPHKLLFSATLSQDPEKLQQLGLFHPKLYTSVVKSQNNSTGVNDESVFIGKYTTPAELKEYYAVCSKAIKPLLIHHLIKAESWTNILCFVNSSSATKKLAFILRQLSNNEIKIKQLSANLTVKERNTIIEKFKKGEINVLISSDALARGIDIPSVRYVISYDCPKFVKAYVHRIGRTGRAGKEGTSLTLLTSKETNKFHKMISSAGKTSVNEFEVEEEKLEMYESDYEKALTLLAKYLESQKVLSLNNIRMKKKIKSLAERGKFVSMKSKRKKTFIKTRKPKKS